MSWHKYRLPLGLLEYGSLAYVVCDVAAILNMDRRSRKITSMEEVTEDGSVLGPRLQILNLRSCIPIGGVQSLPIIFCL